MVYVVAKSTDQILLLQLDNPSVLENNSVTLTCILPSKPTQVSWWRNGSSSGMWTWMDGDTCQSSPTSLSGFSFSCTNNTVYTLTLIHVHRSQDGETWNCAVNYIGSTMTPSNNITLSVIVYIKTLTIHPQNDIMYLILNQPHNITCTSDFGKPSPSISWFKHLTTGGTTYDIDITGFSSATPLNHITVSTLNFFPSKSDHNMRLSCKGNNGGLTISSGATLINVLYGPNTPEILFKGTNVSGTLNISSGQSLTLSCKSISNPPPTYLWRYPGGSATGAILTIPSIQLNHDGIFTCTAQNTILSSTGRIISEHNTSAVNVFVLDPITNVSVVGKNVGVVWMKEQETKYFKCETSTGKPVATVQWYKDNNTPDKITDDIPFFPSSFNTTIRVDSSVRSVLKYKAVRQDHDMSIYCTATNVGAVLPSEAKITLIISSPPETPVSLEVPKIDVDYPTVCWRYTDNIKPGFILESQRLNFAWTYPKSDMIEKADSKIICTCLRMLEPSTQYKVRVFATNKLGNSSYSNIESFTTQMLSTTARVPSTPEEPSSNDSTDEPDGGILTALAVVLCMLHGMYM